MTDGPVLVHVEAGVAMVTLHRPEVRNAINPEMRTAIWDTIGALESDEQVEVVILTGSDPAFCAGLDLKQLAATPDRMLSSGERGSASPFPARVKPLIGAINGAAITGGFELALNCDFLVASEYAVFADTHARVGVMPGWGLTPLLVEAVGLRRARQISLTGNFVPAAQAMTWGLVNEVVAHADLLPRVQQLASDIVGNDAVGVRQMLATYRSQEHALYSRAWDAESAGAAAFASERTPGSDVGDRLGKVISRGRSQLS